MKILFRNSTVFILSVLLATGVCSFMGSAQASNASAPAFYMSGGYGPQNPGMQIPSSSDSSCASSTSSSVTLPSGTTYSSNWAGYIDVPSSGSSYSSVSGSWTVPDVSGSSNGSAAAQWIGLGGVSSSDLLQMGTLEYVSNGKTSYEVFYEKLPDSAQYALAVEAGDTVTMSISEDSSLSGTWNLSYTIVGTDGSSTTGTVTETLDSTYEEEIGTSAEWVSEVPSNGNGQLYALADMGTVEYSIAKVDDETIDASCNTVEPVALISNNEIEIYPSDLCDDGMSFSTYQNDSESEYIGPGSSGSDSGNSSSSSSGTSSSGSTSGNSSYGPSGYAPSDQRGSLGQSVPGGMSGYGGYGGSGGFGGGMSRGRGF